MKGDTISFLLKLKCSSSCFLYATLCSFSVAQPNAHRNNDNRAIDLFCWLWRKTIVSFVKLFSINTFVLLLFQTFVCKLSKKYRFAIIDISKKKMNNYILLLREFRLMKGMAEYRSSLDTLSLEPKKGTFIFLYLVKSKRESGCGTVDRSVTSNTRGPGFESRNRQLLINIFTVNFL